MDEKLPYPRVTRVIRVMAQAWLQHWVAFEERKRMLTMMESMSFSDIKAWAKGLPRCTDDACQCAAQTVLDEGAEKGTALHKAIDAYLDGNPIDPGIAKFAYDRWLRWFKKEQPRVVAKEFKAFSHTWKVQGTCDALLQWTGRGYTVGDWKSSNHLSPLYWLQIALYTGMSIECGRFTWDDLDEERAGLIARFDKREDPWKAKDIVWLTRKQLRRCWDVACSLRRPYDFAVEHDMLKVGG